jgi:hyperosmotically inducible periplasmic protein
MNRKFAIALLAGALAIPAGFAADKNQQHMDPYVQGPANESRLIQEVRHQLVMLPYYSIFDDLGFRVDGSTITLTGQVTNPVLKSDAGNVVKRVEGVTNVVNNIEVLPLSPMDNQIRRAVGRAIYGDPTLSTRYGFQAMPSIHIIVKNGHVRLEGVVANQMDKQIAGTRANSVPNVFSVDNELKIEAKPAGK